MNIKKITLIITTLIILIFSINIYLTNGYNNSKIENKINSNSAIKDKKNNNKDVNLFLYTFLKEELTILKNELLKESKLKIVKDEEKKNHIKIPENVKSLYFSAHSINNKDKFENFLKIAKEKEINSIMIDVKEVDGYTSFSFNDDDFGNIKPVSNNRIKDIKSIIKKLHLNNIYVIARIAIFKDKRLAGNRPDLAIKWINNGKVWTDYNGNKYTDPNSKEVWDYHKELALASYKLGFDEINFDYIRFPTDGYVSQTYYPFSNEIYKKDSKWGRIKVIDKFSNYITTEIRKVNKNIILSADVFGLTTDTNLFQIGQNLESFLLTFDFVGPMIYPSHYGKGYYGYTYPDNNPYAIINTSLNNTKKKIEKLNLEIKNSNIDFRELRYNENFSYNIKTSNKVIDIKQIRPFLQGFSCTRCTNYTLYNRDKFRKAVKGVTDAGIDSWWVRSAGSYYRYDRYNKK